MTKERIEKRKEIPKSKSLFSFLLLFI
ncbi:rCG31786 [Rattus norvegicus]|uniref:RCG31786 n=1 Tax=Rattus norvegicus TaxID=10116 RepID=A6JND5_RAT|nr:rCG31786 [Rattus norvegicus]